MKPVRLLLLLIMPLLLSGCFLVPGTFTSNLDLRKDGTFTFAYKGQIVFLSPNDLDGKSQPKTWSEKMAKCYTGGRTYLDEWAVEDTTMSDVEVKPATGATVSPPKSTADDMMMDEATAEKPRACTPAEIATLKKEFDDRQREQAERNKKEAEQMAALFGIGPMDDAGAQRLAANLMKYEGWKSVVSRGKGVYDVDYQITGRTGHDFVFPVFPQGDIILPFVTMRGREGGGVFVSAPAYAGGGFKGLAARASLIGGMGMSKDMPRTSVVTQGRFTVTTNGEIATNNTVDGPSRGSGGQTLVWEVDNGSEKIPEALIRLR